MLVETSTGQGATFQAPAKIETAQKPPAEGGFRNSTTGEPTLYYSEAVPPRSRLKSQASTSVRWVAGTPLVGMISESPLPPPADPTRKEIQSVELLKAEPGDSVRVILEKVRQHTHILGVGMDTATDHVLGPNSQAGEHLGTLSGYQASTDGISRRALHDEASRRGDPSHPNGVVAKQLTKIELARIEIASQQAQAYREKEAEQRSPFEIQGIGQAEMNELVESIIEQARSAAIIKRKTGAKTDGSQLSWYDSSSNDIAEQVKGHADIVPTNVIFGETAEIVTGEITGEPADADEAFQKLMDLVNPDGGIMLAKVPLTTATDLLDRYTKEETGEHVRLGGQIDAENMVVIYTRTIAGAKTF